MNYKQAGFKEVKYHDLLRAIECPHCAAMINENNWQKHLTSTHRFETYELNEMKRKINHNLYG